MYTKHSVAKELKRRIDNGDSCHNIGDWAYGIYLENCGFGSKDDILDDILLSLDSMTNGPEFEMTKKQLYEIVDKLLSEDK